jgi:hypothetical protein
MDHLCELYIDIYSNLFFYKDNTLHNVLFHVIKSHLIKRINIFKEELIRVTWAPERIYFLYNIDDINSYNIFLKGHPATEDQ